MEELVCTTAAVESLDLVDGVDVVVVQAPHSKNLGARSDTVLGVLSFEEAHRCVELAGYVGGFGGRLDNELLVVGVGVVRHIHDEVSRFVVFVSGLVEALLLEQHRSFIFILQRLLQTLRRAKRGALPIEWNKCYLVVGGVGVEMSHVIYDASLTHLLLAHLPLLLGLLLEGEELNLKYQGGIGRYRGRGAGCTVCIVGSTLRVCEKNELVVMWKT